MQDLQPLLYLLRQYWTLKGILNIFKTTDRSKNTAFSAGMLHAFSEYCVSSRNTVLFEETIDALREEYCA